MYWLSFALSVLAVLISLQAVRLCRKLERRNRKLVAKLGLLGSPPDSGTGSRVARRIYGGTGARVIVLPKDEPTREDQASSMEPG